MSASHTRRFLPSAGAAPSADPADLVGFPRIRMVTIDGAFGGWTRAQATHFADGGVFDRIHDPRGAAAR